MKLNNKGFAITGILYGLLILFALLVGSYLTILTAKKNRLDGIVTSIEEEYNANSTYNGTFNIIINIMGSPVIKETVNADDDFEATVWANGMTDISCDNGMGTIDRDGNLKVTNITDDTICDIG